MKVVKELPILLVLALLIITGGASAELTMQISHDKGDAGLIANGHDPATITVYVYDNSTPVSDVQVNFTVIHPEFGTVNPATAMTDGTGRATAIFTAGTQPGFGEIRADTDGITNTTTLRIVEPIPDDSSYIESSIEWLVANASDKATITVYAFNSSPSYSNYPLEGLQVLQFGVNNTIFGTFSPVTAVTNSEGIAQSTFTTKTKSGTALLYGNISYEFEGVPYLKNLTPYQQKIDHDTPFRISEYNYTYRVDVGVIVPLAFNITDQWENPVDNRRIAEEVNFTVSSPSPLPKGAGFIDGSDYSRSKTVPVDSVGRVGASLKTDEVPGWNYIIIHPLMYDASGNQAFTDKPLVIEGVPGKPVRIEAAFTPADFRQPADGVRVFDITYTLWDKYNNFVQNRSVRVETSIPGEGKIVGTNPQGQAVLQYGPKWSIGMVQITATALDNTSVTHTQQVWFVPQEPADVLFTVSPQTMPSRDVPNPGKTWLIATIVDEYGNPVNESVQVTFGFDGVTYDKTYDVTVGPEIPVPTALTDEYGIAMVEFLPGGFNASNQTPSTGRCDVTATWGGITRSVQVVWKNYPYLSVEAYASTNLVEVNETVDITVLLKGDGYKLFPPPIDVVLCTDRSGSMLKNTSDGIMDDRMVHAMTAAKIFNSEMSSRDRVGLVSFGDNSATNNYAKLAPTGSGYTNWNNIYGGHYADHNPPYLEDVGWWWVSTDNSYDCNPYSYSSSSVHHKYILAHYPGSPKLYSSFGTIDLPLSFDRSTVNTTINNMVPAGGTPMREGLYKSVKMLRDNGRSDAIKGIVLLSDGAWNTGGDPEGSSTATSFSGIGRGSVIDWANQSGIKIFTVAIGNESNHPELVSYAAKTGGKFYWASTADQLSNIYSDIAGELKTEAGVNTQMDLDYENIIVNYTTVEYNDPDDPIFDYVYLWNISTKINSYMIDHSELDIPDLPWRFNNTSDWAATRTLSFTLGTVHLYQVWDIRYRLVARQEGNFTLFGPESQITFEGADEPLTLPNLTLRVNPKLSGTPIENIELYYTQIDQNQSADNPDFYVTFNISHQYNGDKNVREDYYIVTYDGRRYYLGSTVLTPEEAGQLRQYRILVSKLPVGWTRLEPILTEIGWEAPGPIIPAQPIPIAQQAGDPNRSYIRLT